MDIVFATNNNNKIIEIKQILKDTELNVLSLIDLKIDVDVIEDGETFEDNALLKALAIMKLTNKIVLSDDSGLEIDYLDREPGVKSSRFLGTETPYPVKNKKILEMLENVPAEKRTARFVCVIALAIPCKNGEPKTHTIRETFEGIIANEILGENGFGYDPIFYLPQHGKTSAEISPELKNKISHRGKALRAMKDYLTKNIISLK